MIERATDEGIGREEVETLDVEVAESDRTAQGQQRKPYLMVIHGPALGLSHALSGERTIVGRDTEVDLCIDDEGVSRNHAAVETKGHGLVLSDLASRNGVFVNGRRVDQHLLVSGDRVWLGSGTILKYIVQDEFEEGFQRHLYDSSIRDGLTGAFNKRYFDEQLRTEFTFAVRHKQPLSLMMFDVDYFKSFNDRYGHLTGDYVLRELVRVARRHLRTEDTLARYGGDEFAVILRQTDVDRGRAIAQRLCELVRGHRFEQDDLTFGVTISIGIATQRPGRYANPAELVASADDYLYEAKRGGRSITATASFPAIDLSQMRPSLRDDRE